MVISSEGKELFFYIISLIIIFWSLLFMFDNLNMLLAKDPVAFAVGASFTGSLLFWLVYFLMIERKLRRQQEDQIKRLEKKIDELCKH